MAQHMTLDWTDVSSLAPLANAMGKILALISVLSNKGTTAWKHFSQALTTCASQATGLVQTVVDPFLTERQTELDHSQQSV